VIEFFAELGVDGEVKNPKMKEGRPRLSSRDRWLANTLRNIHFRCANPKDKKFKHYGGRGIRNMLTLEDLQFLYERDRPDLMQEPSIDRKDVAGHYDRNNCQFIEMATNRMKRWREARKVWKEQQQEGAM